MRRSLALLLFVPSLVLAQTTTTPAAGAVATFESNDDSNTPGVINITECTNHASDKLRFDWTLPAGSVSTDNTAVTLTVSTDGTCPLGANTTRWSPDDSLTVNASGTGHYLTTGFPNIDDLGLILDKFNLLTCSGTSITTFTVCVSPGTSPTTSNSAKGTFTFDPTVPAPPVITGITPGDSHLKVSFNAGTGGVASATSYKAFATADDPNKKGEASATAAGSADITGLENGVTYTVKVVAYSKVNNPSADSNTMSETPIPVDDFWRLYRDAQGREQGGCASGPAGLLGLLFPALFLLRRRRS